MKNKDFDNIKIPENISEYINNGIEKADKEIKIHKRKNFRKVSLTAAMITLIILVVSVTNPTVAQELPILKNIFKALQNDSVKFLPNADYAAHAKELNLSQEYNGITITAQEYVYDGNSVYIAYKIESKDGFPYKTLKYAKTYITDENGNVIDGKDWVEKDIDWIWFDESEKLSYNTLSNNPSGLTGGSPRARGKFIDNNTFIGIMVYDIPLYDNVDGNIVNLNKPEEFNLEININSISLPIKEDKFWDLNTISASDNEYIVQGKWNFSIPIKEEPSMKNVIKINEIKDGFELESITKTPFSTILKIVPLNKENQINLNGNGDKVAQLQVARLIDSNGNYLNSDGFAFGTSQPHIGEIPLRENEVAGTIEMYIPNYNIESYGPFSIVVEDYTRIGEACTKECENIEHHINSPHPKTITFETKIN